MIGNGFKFLWSGVCKAENGVGVIVANWLIGKFVKAERFNDRVMRVNVVIGNVVWEVVSCYCPQAGRSVNEKEEFYELMGNVAISEKVLVGGDFDGHVGSDTGGFGEVHGGLGIGQKMEGSNCWTEQLVKGCIWWILVSKKRKAGLQHSNWVELKQ